MLVLNLQCGMELNQFCPPTSSEDVSLLFCLILILWRQPFIDNRKKILRIKVYNSFACDRGGGSYLRHMRGRLPEEAEAT